MQTEQVRSSLNNHYQVPRRRKSSVSHPAPYTLPAKVSAAKAKAQQTGVNERRMSASYVVAKPGKGEGELKTGGIQGVIQGGIQGGIQGPQAVLPLPSHHYTQPETIVPSPYTYPPAPSLEMQEQLIQQQILQEQVKQQMERAKDKIQSQHRNGKSAKSVPMLSREFVVRRISEGESGRLKEELKCEACGKGYKHITSLAKHLWEHTPEWQKTKKLSISKHQQVQLLEAASILCSMTEKKRESSPYVYRRESFSQYPPSSLAGGRKPSIVSVQAPLIGQAASESHAEAVVAESAVATESAVAAESAVAGSDGEETGEVQRASVGSIAQ